MLHKPFGPLDSLDMGMVKILKAPIILILTTPHYNYLNQNSKNFCWPLNEPKGCPQEENRIKNQKILQTKKNGLQTFRRKASKHMTAPSFRTKRRETRLTSRINLPSELERNLFGRNFGPLDLFFLRHCLVSGSFLKMISATSTQAENVWRDLQFLRIHKQVYHLLCHKLG